MKRFISLFFSILLSAVALTWFAQNSINAYWQQTYHENSPLEPLSEYAWWRIGADWQQKAYEFSDGLKASLETEDALASEDSGIETARPSENTEDIEYRTIKKTLLLPMRLTIRIPQPASQAIRLIIRQHRSC